MAATGATTLCPSGSTTQAPPWPQATIRSFPPSAVRSEEPQSSGQQTTTPVAASACKDCPRAGRTVPSAKLTSNRTDMRRRRHIIAQRYPALRHSNNHRHGEGAQGKGPCSSRGWSMRVASARRRRAYDALCPALRISSVEEPAEERSAMPAMLLSVMLPMAVCRPVTGVLVRVGRRMLGIRLGRPSR